MSGHVHISILTDSCLPDKDIQMNIPHACLPTYVPTYLPPCIHKTYKCMPTNIHNISMSIFEISGFPYFQTSGISEF